MMPIGYFTSRLSYLQDLGVFIWKSRPQSDFKTHGAYRTWNTRFSGTIAGTILASGHISIKLYGKFHYAHRLAWLFTHGEWPEDQIDHKNGNPGDNKITNLRSVNDSENKKNLPLRKDNSSGCIGVSWHKKAGKWSAYINANKKRCNLGLFPDFCSAIEAREKAELELGFHANHGRCVGVIV